MSSARHLPVQASPESLKPKEICHLFSSGRLEIKLSVKAQGRDLLVQLTGGDAHIGCVALGSRMEGVRLLTVNGHKEGELAEMVTERLCTLTGRTVCTLAGIHYEAASRKEIEEICQGVVKLLEKVSQEICPAPVSGTI